MMKWWYLTTLVATFAATGAKAFTSVPLNNNKKEARVMTSFKHFLSDNNDNDGDFLEPNQEQPEGEIAYNHYQDQQFAAETARWKKLFEIYTERLPPEEHKEWLERYGRGSRGGPLPILPLEPQDYQNFTGDELTRTTIPYFYEIFQSLMANGNSDNMPELTAPGEVSFPVPDHLERSAYYEFTHDSLKWETKVEIVKVFRDGRVDVIVHMHIPVDAAIFRSMINGQSPDGSNKLTRHSGREYHCIGEGNDIPIGFYNYAKEFFKGQKPKEIIYFCPEANCLELIYRVWRQQGRKTRKVDLKICFEPGWPAEPFDEDAWFEQNLPPREP